MPEDINESKEKFLFMPAINNAPTKQIMIEITDNTVNFSLKTILPMISTIIGAR